MGRMETKQVKTRRSLDVSNLANYRQSIESARAARGQGQRNEALMFFALSGSLAFG